MSKKELFSWFLFGAVSGFIGAYAMMFVDVRQPNIKESVVPYDSKFGNWLAVQHAIFADDFDGAVEFANQLKGVKSEIVSDARNLVLFLGSDDVSDIHGKVDGIGAYKIINGALGAKSGKWADVWKSFSHEKSSLLIPFYIWSGIGTGHFKDILKTIDSLPMASTAWKDFTKATIYAATKNPKTARKYFRKVPTSFMNLGDYYLVMSFYKKQGFSADAAKLRGEWLGSAGGMFMSNLDLGADWKYFDSLQKMLAFGLVQYVSHSGDDGFSDAGLFALRSAALLGGQPDSINYYTGGYFYFSGSPNYKKYWKNIEKHPIYAPFVRMKTLEKDGLTPYAVRKMGAILRENPLFVPLLQKLWQKYVSDGRQAEAMWILDRALKQPNVPDAGRAFLLKMRGHTFYIFGEYDEAEADLEQAAELSGKDAEIFALQARVWAAKGTNLNEAYRYALSLVKAFPANIDYWDVLAMVVMANDGEKPAQEILEKVGRVAEENSELFVHLGDLRLRAGSKIGAKDAYEKALLLSDDGRTIKEEIINKLKKVK